jgi:hypothetical protein
MSLERLLTWTDVSTELTGYEKAFHDRAERRLVSAIQICRSIDRPTARCLLGILRTLPGVRIVRLAAAPELEYLLRQARLSNDGGKIARFLIESLQAELASEPNAGRRASRLLWTALGDFQVGATKHTASGVEPTGLASAVGPPIALDFSSPYHRGDLPHRFPEHANYEASARAAIAEKIGRASALVQAAGPDVTRFVSSFTSVIVPLRVDSATHWFGSFSSSWYPGRSVLVNAHLPDMRVHDVAAALVHEAIHSLVDASELDGRLLVGLTGGRRCGHHGLARRSPCSRF